MGGGGSHCYWNVLCFQPFLLDRAKIYLFLKCKVNHKFTWFFPSVFTSFLFVVVFVSVSS